MKAIQIEEAIFAFDRALQLGNSAAGQLNELAQRIRPFSPDGAGAELVKALAELARSLRNILGESTARIRNQMMDCGAPSDQAGCDRCDSADFSNQECIECARVRSDGLQLARRLSGWRA